MAETEEQELDRERENEQEKEREKEKERAEGRTSKALFLRPAARLRGFFFPLERSSGLESNHKEPMHVQLFVPF
jgi:hypothetical protein